MKSKKAVVMAFILAVFTCITAFIHISTRNVAEEGMIQILYNEEIHSIAIEQIDYEKVTGIRVNGKGEEQTVDALGVLFKNILEDEGVCEYSEVNVISDDSYSATLTAEEVNIEEKVYLICEEEGQLRLIVFGDKNSKRSVSNVVRIIVE